MKIGCFGDTWFSKNNDILLLFQLFYKNDFTFFKRKYVFVSFVSLVGMNGLCGREQQTGSFARQISTFFVLFFFIGYVDYNKQIKHCKPYSLNFQVIKNTQTCDQTFHGLKRRDVQSEFRKPAIPPR